LSLRRNIPLLTCALQPRQPVGVEVWHEFRPRISDGQAKEARMKTILVLFFAVLSTSALADVPGADWLTKQQIVDRLHSLGYTNITDLEADDGHWEGDAVKDGKTYELHIDPHTGQLTKNEPKN
jgi:peptidase YpeB-like protein